jgi:hypothetical protein
MTRQTLSDGVSDGVGQHGALTCEVSASVATPGITAEGATP